MSSCTPSAASSCEIAADTDDCDTGMFSAASVTLPASAAATKYCSWRSVKRMAVTVASVSPLGDHSASPGTP